MLLSTLMLHVILFASHILAAPGLNSSPRKRACKPRPGVTQNPLGTQPNTVGTPLVASFTRYGTGDETGSDNCATSGGACGGPTGRGPPPGYTVAVSQNLYDGPAYGVAGKACYKCYLLSYNNRNITVTVSNLCPADNNNPWCSMPSMDGPPNAKGGYVNFDLCDNTGARAALLGDEVTGLGTATLLANCPDQPQTA